MKLSIVGAGLAGSMLTRLARDAGHEVELVSLGRPGSTAALALLRPSHLPAEDRHLLEPSLTALKHLGGEVIDGATFSRWDRPDLKFQADWHAVDPQAVLLEPDREAWVTDTTGDRAVWTTADGAGKRTYGGTWVNPDPAALAYLPGGGNLAVHMIAPYKVLAAARFASGCRLGSSSSTTREKALAQAAKLWDIALGLGWIARGDGWHLIEGSRMKRNPGERLRKVGPTTWRWSGFHRTGYGVAPAEAVTVLREVTK